jgi:transcriptional regulator EpsA
MPLVNKFSENERDLFLRVMQESLTIDRQSQLFLWLQGDFQHFLPHDVLVILVGDFANSRIRVDVVSTQPSGRSVSCASCDLRPISEALFDRWQNNGRRMLTINGDLSELLALHCACVLDNDMHGKRSAMVHGLRDERSGEDALYIALRSEPFFDEAQRRMFALLLPHIDHACRRVAALNSGQTCAPPVAVAEEVLVVPANDNGLSSRELEILEWVRAGKTNVEIGMILNISAFTVKNHLQRIFRKMDVMNRTQAVAKVEGYWRAARQ